MKGGARSVGQRLRVCPRIAADRRSPLSIATRPALSRPAAALALLALPAILGAGRLHTELKSSDPAKDTVLAEPPAAITLTYTTDVQLAPSSVEVRPAGGGHAPAASGTLAYLADDRKDVLVLPLTGRLRNGTYTVAWTTAGPDGHPIRGTFDFTVESPEEAQQRAEAAAAAEAGLATTAAEEAGETEPQGDEGVAPGVFDSSGWLHRVLLYAGIVALLGGIVFRLLVLGHCAREGESRRVIDRASRNAALIVAGGLGFLLATVPVRLWDQAKTLFPDDAAGNLLTVATGTPWAVGWWLQLVAVLLALLGGGLVLRAGKGSRTGRGGHPAGWMVIAAGALLLPAVPVLSGHGWSDDPRVLSAAATYLHVVAAGGWMGGLACLLMAGLPAFRKHGGESLPGAPGIAGMVGAFSRVAQAAVALLLVTGAIKVWVHIGSPSDLWTTAWGRTLLIKDLLVVGVLALGLYNWRVVRPALADSPHPGRLQRSAMVELVLGTAVVVVTSFLVTQPLG